MDSNQQPLVFLLLLLGLLLIFFSIPADSFVHPLTGKRHSVSWTVDYQVEVGRAAALATEREHGGLLPDTRVQAWVRQIGMRIVQALESAELQLRKQRGGLALNWSVFPYEFRVLQSYEFVAAAAPGFVLITRGALKDLARDDLVAFVLAHEISHIVLRHFPKKQQLLGLVDLIKQFIQTAWGEQQKDLTWAAHGVIDLFTLSYSREYEREADHLGYILCCLAGYDPRAAIEVFRILKRMESSDNRPPILRTHPSPDSRLDQVKHLTCALPIGEVIRR